MLSPIIAGVIATRAAKHPSNPTLVVREADEDGLLWWLSDRSQAAADFSKNYLLDVYRPGGIVNYASQTITVMRSGLPEIFARQESAQFFGASESELHHPDVFAIAQVGTIDTTGTKIAEHGGHKPRDPDVLRVVYAPGVVHPQQCMQWGAKDPGRSDPAVNPSPTPSPRPSSAASGNVCPLSVLGLGIWMTGASLCDAHLAA